MSRVYEAHLEMEELFEDQEFQDFLQQREYQAQNEAYGTEHCGNCRKKYVSCNPVEDFCQGWKGFDNMEDNKAQEFARKILEVA